MESVALPEYTRQYALLLVGFGDPGEHEQAAERICQTLPPLFDHVTPMPYTVLQQMLDEASTPGSLRLRQGRLL